MNRWMNRWIRPRHVVPCLLIAFSVLTRVMPHPPNFTALASIAMFASFYLGTWKLGAVVPLVSLVISDLLLGTYDPRLMAVVYASCLFPVMFGSILRGRLKAGRVVCFALCSSATFFVSTNLAVWSFGDWYTHDAAGLSSCFAAALPFFRYTLASDLVFSSSIFGAYALALHWQASSGPARRWLAPQSQVAA